MKASRVAIIGSRTLGQHIAHYINQSGNLQVAGYFDDFRPKGHTINQIEVLGSIAEIETYYQNSAFDSLIIGIGYNHFEVRQQLFHNFRTLIPFETYIHPSAVIDPSVSIGEGVVILPGCILDMNVQIGNNIFFNIGCFVAHDSVVKDNVFFGPGVKVAGFVSIGSNCFLGINTCIVNNLQIKNDIYTGAGAVVTKDLIEPGKYVGVPAIKIK